jgi:serine/threonine protein kinase
VNPGTKNRNAGCPAAQDFGSFIHQRYSLSVVNSWIAANFGKEELPLEKKLALVIGVNSYPWQPLDVCVNDANEMMATLSMPEYGFDVFPLFDRDATRKKFLESLNTFFRTPADTYLFYFTGHGLASDLGAFLCPVDIDVEPEGIDLDLITKYLDRVVSPDASVVLILDCCHAGAAKLGQWVASSQPLAPQTLAQTLLRISRGRVLLAACSGDEEAFTVAELGHSLFTSFLLRGLLSEAADATGRVTVSSLHDFVAHECKTAAMQTPVFKGEIAGPFVLGSNLPPGVRKDLSEDMVQDIERQAASHLEAFQTDLSVLSRDLERWKKEGHRAACQMLEPLLLWLNEKKSEHRELASRKGYMSAYKGALQKLANLSALEEGFVTSQGAITEKLGAGLFGTVWKVDQGETGPPLAYKIYHPQDLQIADKMRRFERGYRAMKQLDHPFIVKVHNYTNCPRGFFMDFVPGANLRDFMGDHVTVEDRVSLLVAISETLRHSHSRKVCHRDVKPENIIMALDETSEKWKPYLTDFDLAWFPTGSQLFTKTAMGSLYYAAPEQIMKPASASAHDYKVDLFSFGQLAYFVATNSDPGPMGVGDHAKALERKLRDGWNAESAHLFFALFTCCTQHDPANRPENFSEICDTLYKIAQSFRQMSSALQLPPEVFLRELVFAIVGLDSGVGAAPSSFRSLSEKTEIRMQVRREAAGWIDLRYDFHSQENPIIDGISKFEEVRKTLWTRIEAVLGDFSLARKRPGKSMPFQVYIDHDRVPLTKDGLLISRRLIGRVLEVIEGK